MERGAVEESHESMTTKTLKIEIIKEADGKKTAAHQLYPLDRILALDDGPCGAGLRAILTTLNQQTDGAVIPEVTTSQAPEPDPVPAPAPDLGPSIEELNQQIAQRKAAKEAKAKKPA
jgi:hypothetical protein